MLRQRITSQDGQLRDALRSVETSRRQAQAAEEKMQEAIRKAARSSVASSLATPQQYRSTMTPAPSMSRSNASLGGASVPRARVRIHRSGSIIIDNDQVCSWNYELLFFGYYKIFIYY